MLYRLCLLTERIAYFDELAVLRRRANELSTELEKSQKTADEATEDAKQLKTELTAGRTCVL